MTGVMHGMNGVMHGMAGVMHDMAGVMHDMNGVMHVLVHNTYGRRDARDCSCTLLTQHVAQRI